MVLHIAPSEPGAATLLCKMGDPPSGWPHKTGDTSSGWLSPGEAGFARRLPAFPARSRAAGQPQRRLGVGAVRGSPRGAVGGHLPRRMRDGGRRRTKRGQPVSGRRQSDESLRQPVSGPNVGRPSRRQPVSGPNVGRPSRQQPVSGPNVGRPSRGQPVSERRTPAGTRRQPMPGEMPAGGSRGQPLWSRSPPGRSSGQLMNRGVSAVAARRQPVRGTMPAGSRHRHGDRGSCRGLGRPVSGEGAAPGEPGAARATAKNQSRRARLRSRTPAVRPLRLPARKPSPRPSSRRRTTRPSSRSPPTAAAAGWSKTGRAWRVRPRRRG